MPNNPSIKEIDFEKGDGLVPVVVQDIITRNILMVAYANKDALEKTLETGYAHFWSRSRGKIWLKGETSGNKMRVADILVDCDGDTIIYLVEPTGPACHSGNTTCFYRGLSEAKTLSQKFDEDIKKEIITYFKNAEIFRREWVKDESKEFYNYIVNPLTDNIPPPSAKIVSWIALKIHEQTSNTIDKVVVPEALGIPIASLVAMLKGKPLAIIRKRFFSNKELLDKVEYSSGYEKGTYYIYGVKPGDKVLIIDDAISTGGTLVAVINKLRENNVSIDDVYCVVEKPDYKGVEKVYEVTGVKVKTLIKVFIKDGKLEVYIN